MPLDHGRQRDRPADYDAPSRLDCPLSLETAHMGKSRVKWKQTMNRVGNYI